MSSRTGSLSLLRTQASTLVAQYVDPASNYSFHTYDWAPGRVKTLTPGDLLAANLLSLLFATSPGPGPELLASMNHALHDLTRLDRAFEDFPTLVALEEALEPLAASNQATRAVRGWTPVTVSKVLHRHAPHVVPIDSRLRAFYGSRPGQEAALRRTMWEDLRDNRDWLTRVAAAHQRPDGRPLTLLRAADIIIWMSWDTWRFENH